MVLDQKKKTSSKHRSKRNSRKTTKKQSLKRSSLKRSSKKSRRKRSPRKFNFDTPIRLTVPLKIYTQKGCPACVEIKEFCTKQGIPFIALNRSDYADYVNEKTHNSQFVPNVFNADGDYIGGTEELQKLVMQLK